jgi:hypothetical protein
MASDKVMIRYVGRIGVVDANCDKVTVCNMSKFMADYFQTTGNTELDFTRALDGQDPLSPRIVSEFAINFVRCNFSYGIGIDDIAGFMRGMEVLDLSPYGWDVLDDVLRAILSAENKYRFFEDGEMLVDHEEEDGDSIDWTNNDMVYSFMDTYMDIMSALSPYFEHLPNTIIEFYRLLTFNYMYVDFSFEGPIQVKDILANVAYNKAKVGGQLTFRTTRYSPIDTTNFAAYNLFTNLVDGCGVSFRRRSYD